MLIHMPDDAVALHYIQVKPFQWEQVFSSKSCNFTGTELQFIAKGLAYSYTQAQPFKRIVITN